MRILSLTVATSLLFGVAGSPAIAKTANRHGLDRISDETGVPVATLQHQRTSTRFGYGELEKANLLANASGASFKTIVAKRHAGEGWGKIAHDYRLNLGTVVSSAHRSSKGKQVGKTGTGRSGKGPQFDSGPGFGHGHGHSD